MLVPGQGSVGERPWHLVSVVLAGAIDLAQKEVFQHPRMRERERVAQ